MNTYIDIYCERLGPGLWAEPFNALTNAAFFLAAFFVYLLARRENALNPPAIIFIALLMCIGTGSTLFHTFATPWAQQADVLPILAYQMAFLYLYASCVMCLKPWKVYGLFAVFMVSSAIADSVPSSVLNGSVSYIPALLFMTGFGIWHARTGQKEPYVLLLSASLFTISLTFRSIDMTICNALPVGTHFLWHGLNGAVLYLTARSYIIRDRAS